MTTTTVDFDLTVAEDNMPLHLKYRPQTLSEVRGQDKTINSIKSVLQSKNIPHVWVFTGITGSGKTTLARILAKLLGTSDLDLKEVDAATFGSVEDIREYTKQTSYAPVMGKAKAVILDEVQAMSKAAWQALLKSLEDTPSHMFWFLLTTEKHKILREEAIVSRSHIYQLEPVKSTVLVQLAFDVATKEGISLPHDKDPLEPYMILAEAAQGSPRQLLVYLSQCRGAKTLQEVRDLTHALSDEENNPIIEIAKLIGNRNKNFNEYVPHLLVMKEEPHRYTGIRLILNAWFANGTVKNPQFWRNNVPMLAAINNSFEKYEDEKELLAHTLLFLARAFQTMEGK